jgi:hypothetical protein
MKLVSESTFRFRRQVMIALILCTIAFISDTVAKHGSELPISSVFTTFLVLSTGPIVLNRVIEMLAGKDNA